jgi:hypothetical protein
VEGLGERFPALAAAAMPVIGFLLIDGERRRLSSELCTNRGNAEKQPY